MIEIIQWLIIALLLVLSLYLWVRVDSEQEIKWFDWQEMNRRCDRDYESLKKQIERIDKPIYDGTQEYCENIKRGIGE